MASQQEFFQVIQPQGMYQPSTYNHAMRAGNTIYVAGQVARDEHGVLVDPNDAEGQARKVFENLTRVLEAAGAGFSNVVKVTTYLTHATDSKAVSDVRLEFFWRSSSAAHGLDCGSFRCTRSAGRS